MLQTLPMTNLALKIEPPDNVIPPSNPWVKRLAFLTCFSVMLLIFVGALVTSNDAGLSVPDWPSSYGYNMFTFPPSLWLGGIFYEHTHRLLASGIGTLTVVLCILTLIKENRRWLKLLTVAALGIVILQGLLGGLTVLFKLPLIISAAHGVLAQTFFVITIIIAYSHSNELRTKLTTTYPASLRKIFRAGITIAALIYLQLIVGAIMRHSESGLAITDFPTMAGSYLPSFSSQTLTKINEARADLKLGAVDNLQVFIHLAHRLLGIVILITIFVCHFKTISLAPALPNIRRLSNIILALGLVQFALGVSVILSLRGPILTSVHVLGGATLLGCSVFLCLRSANFSELFSRINTN